MDINQLTRIPTKVVEVDSYLDDGRTRTLLVVHYLNGEKEMESVYGGTERRPEEINYDYPYLKAWSGMGTVDYSDKARAYLISTLDELRRAIEGLEITSEEFIERVLGDNMFPNGQ